MIIEQYISVADVILGVHVAVSRSVGDEEVFFLFSCLIREWLWGKDNAGILT